MSESRANDNTNAESATRRKSGFWRVFKWAALAAGGGLVLLLGFVVVVAVPELRREVPPPEISGPDRVASKPSDLPSSSTSTTRSVDPPISGTSAILNLDDFPHLSPTMRSLTQAWLDQCAETDRALDRISDPTLRAQAAAFLENRKKIRALLNLPLEWDELEYREVVQKAERLKWQSYGNSRFYYALRGLDIGISAGSTPEDVIARRIERIERLIDVSSNNSIFRERDSLEQSFLQVMKGCPELAALFSKETMKIEPIESRIGFELDAHRRKWLMAAASGFRDNCRGQVFPPQTDRVVSRDEEAYALRQSGIRGKVALITHSCQDALIKSRVEDRIPRPLYQKTQTAGDLAIVFLVVNPANKEWDVLYKEKLTPQDRVTSGSETVKYEDLSTRTTSATLETGN